MSIKRELSMGAQGDDVKALQEALNKNGANLTVDGIYGTNTANAVVSYQKKNDLDIDGIVGNQTWGALFGNNSLGSSSASTTSASGTKLPTTQISAAPSGYTPTAAPSLSPTPTAPKYDTTKWDDTEKGAAAGNAYNTAKDAVNNYGNFEFSENEWLEKLKGDIANNGEFSYDVNSDALYQQYVDQYTRLGKLASQDVMGQAAAMTGGFGNSYAATVGNQAYQSYLQQVNDKVPELYQLALDRYKMGKQDLYDQYGLLLSEYEREYGLYSDEYNKLLDALGIAKDDYYSGADMFHTEQGNQNSVLGQEFSDAMAKWEADTSNAWKQAEWDESLNQYANDEAWRQAEWDESLRQYNEQFAYQKDRDTVADNQWQTAFDYQKDRDTVEDSQWQSSFDEGVRQFDANMAEDVRQFNKSIINSKQNTTSKDTTPTLTAKEYNEVLTNAGVYAKQGKSALKTYLNGLVSRGLSQDEAADIYEQYFPSLPAKTPTFTVGSQQHTLN